jgi:hypothetical protein
MGNEPDKKVDSTADWSMPEPVFQSSEGRPPGKRQHVDPQQDITTQPGLIDPEEEIPTEPGFRNDPEEDIPTEPGFKDDPQAEISTAPGFRTDADRDDVVGSTEGVGYKAEPPAPRPAGGCAKTMLSLVGIVAFAIIGIVCLLVYLLFYYRPASSNF